MRLLAESAMASVTPSGMSTAAVGEEKRASRPSTLSTKSAGGAGLPASSTARPVAGLSRCTLWPNSSTTTSMPEGSRAMPTGFAKVQACPTQLLAMTAEPVPLPAMVATARVAVDTLRMRLLSLSATYKTEPEGVTATV